MNDLGIRQALKDRLIARFAKEPTALIIDELPLNKGEARADIVVIGSKLHGYEIKSNLDTLVRLPQQVKNYSEVFGYVSLVVGYKHAYEAAKIIPDWWGLILAEVTRKEHIRLIVARKSQRNPEPDKMALVRLLWRDEAISILDQYNMLTGVRSKPNEEIYKRIVDNLDWNMLHTMVCQKLRLRENWRVDASLLPSDD